MTQVSGAFATDRYCTCLASFDPYQSKVKLRPKASGIRWRGSLYDDLSLSVTSRVGAMLVVNSYQKFESVVLL